VVIKISENVPEMCEEEGYDTQQNERSVVRVAGEKSLRELRRGTLGR